MNDKFQVGHVGWSPDYDSNKPRKQHCPNPTTLTNSEALPLTTCSASWLPIETAPKDGSDIIIGFDSAAVWIVHVAWWRELEDWMRDDPQWSKEDVGWWSYTKHSVTQEKLEDHRMPTHWMPLPSLPNDKDLARRVLDSE